MVLISELISIIPIQNIPPEDDHAAIGLRQIRSQLGDEGMNIDLVAQISRLTEVGLCEVIAECGLGSVISVCRDLMEHQRLQELNLVSLGSD